MDVQWILLQYILASFILAAVHWQHCSCFVPQPCPCSQPCRIPQAAVVRQAEDRAHRHGQQSSSVNVYFLCARGTSDDRRSDPAARSTGDLQVVNEGTVLVQ